LLRSGTDNKEIIFSTQYMMDEAANGIQQHLLPAIKGGWHGASPLGDLVETYQFKNGDSFDYEDLRYDPKNISKNRDPRLGYSVLFNGDKFGDEIYISHPDSSASPDQLGAGKQTTQTGFGLKKFMNPNMEGNLKNSDIGLHILRYAEVLLGYLEAELDSGHNIDQQLLDETINKVRGRSSVDMPPITITE